MRPGAVSDFSVKMSKHFLHNSVMPLSEANLSKHTLQSPPTREAKLRHILVYVSRQRELIALEDEVHRTMAERATMMATKSGRALLLNKMNNNTNINTATTSTHGDGDEKKKKKTDIVQDNQNLTRSDQDVLYNNSTPSPLDRTNSPIPIPPSPPPLLIPPISSQSPSDKVQEVEPSSTKDTQKQEHKLHRRSIVSLSAEALDNGVNTEQQQEQQQEQEQEQQEQVEQVEQMEQVKQVEQMEQVKQVEQEQEVQEVQQQKEEQEVIQEVQHQQQKEEEVVEVEAVQEKEQSTIQQTHVDATPNSPRNYDSYDSFRYSIVPIGLDPFMALPRALPRSMKSRCRDSFHSSIGSESEWHRNHDGGDTHMATVVHDAYPAYEFASRQDWRQGRHQRPWQYQQQQFTAAGTRPIQYRKQEESGDSVAFIPQLAKQQITWPMEKDKKTTGKLGRFSFLNKKKGHQQRGSLPAPARTKGDTNTSAYPRSHSLTNESKPLDAVDLKEAEGVISVKRRSKLKQLFQDVFKRPSSSSRTRPDVFQGESRSVHGMVASATAAQVAPATVAAPQGAATQAVMSYFNQAHGSLPGPLHHHQQHQGRQLEQTFQKMELEDDQFQLKDSGDTHTPYPVQTPLTPPPASSVLRHSASLPQILSNGHVAGASGKKSDGSGGEFETLGPISGRSGGGGGGGRRGGRLSAQFMPTSSSANRDLTASFGDSEAQKQQQRQQRQNETFTSQRRFVAIAPEQRADLEGVGPRQKTLGAEAGVTVAVV